MSYTLTKKDGLSTVSFEILGEPASKANSRRLVYFGKRPAFIKSNKARSYTESFRSQCPNLDIPISGDVIVTINIWYASRRPDLDESIILDAMQGLIYVNDRQVKVKHIYWHLDKDNPRSQICVQEICSVTPDRKRRGHEEEQEDGNRSGKVVGRRKRGRDT
jgi:Holliday junction resolvase RusA-like endonuclease